MKLFKPEILLLVGMKCLVNYYYCSYFLTSHLQVVEVYFDGVGYTSTPVYLMTGLRAGHQVAGPAVIMDQLSTVLVEPDCKADVTSSGDLLIHIGTGGRPAVGTQLDAIQLSIFSHRFMSIAEQMGR